MKTALTIEESARLIELGVDPTLASKEVATTIYEREYNDPRHPIFTLSDILSILPKEIAYDGLTYGLNIWVENATYFVEYCVENGVYDYLINSDISATELIDAFYHLLIWYLENGHLKTEKK